MEAGNKMFSRMDMRGDNAWNVITPLIEEYLNNMHRAGSQSVTMAAQAYLRVSMKLYTRLVSDDIEQFQNNESTAKRRLQATIGKALSEGPYAELRLKITS